MNYDKWNNYTAIGYLKYALKHYQKIAAEGGELYRELTEDEVRKIIGCMNYAFDMKTLEEAYNLG